MKNKLIEKVIILTLLICIPLVSAQAIVVSGAVVGGLTLTGKILGILGPLVSGGSSLAKGGVSIEMTKEIQALIQEQIGIVNQRLENIEGEARYAETEDDVRRIYDAESALRSERVRLGELMTAVRQEKALTGKQLLSDAKNIGVGYVKGEVATGLLGGLIKGRYDIEKHAEIISGSDNVGGVMTPWSIYEVTEVAGNGVGDLATGIVGTAMTGQEASSAYLGNKEMKPEEQAFYESMVQGRVSRTKAAITDASWEYFINVAAKQQFKDYLRGQSDSFRKLPFAIQEKYIGKLLFMSPDELDDVHNIMSQGRRTGDYSSALKKIIGKYPYYKETFKELTKDLTGDSKEVTKNMETGLTKKIQNQTNVIKNAAKEKAPASTKSLPPPTPTTKTPTPAKPTTNQPVTQQNIDISGVWGAGGIRSRISGDGTNYTSTLTVVNAMAKKYGARVGEKDMTLTRTSYNSFTGKSSISYADGHKEWVRTTVVATENILKATVYMNPTSVATWTRVSD